LSHLVILTGASRGLGLAMARQLLEQPATELLAIARKPNDALAGARLTQWSLDLAEPREAAARVEAWLGEHDGTRFDAATLINNAALVTPPGPVDDTDAAALSDSLRVGLEAPMLLTAAFLRATRAWPGTRRVLNISSGLGRRAMAGSAPYCAAKAGLDNYSCAVALDEAQHANGAKVVSLAPGVIDTDMQVTLRNADVSKFPDRELFAGYKAGGQLASPDAAAAKVLAYLERSDFGRNPLADVRDQP
jgi:NAD(P)-dependent dehydrogenase (short-subunit alcohol dehydrogenase family)